MYVILLWVFNFFFFFSKINNRRNLSVFVSDNKWIHATDVCIYSVVLRRRVETCHFDVINEDSYYVLRRDGAFLYKLVSAGYRGR